MGRVLLGVAGWLASLTLVACGSGDSDANKPLSPSSSAPVANKPRTLTRVEYAAMREWIITSASSSEDVRPLCDRLDAGPETPVLRAARNACDRILSGLLAVEHTLADIRSQCVRDFGCAARGLRGRYRSEYVNMRRAFIAYYRDITRALSDGPCRETLAPAGDLAKFDSSLKEFDHAVSQLARGDTSRFDTLDDNDELRDPTPCRPTPTS